VLRYVTLHMNSLYRKKNWNVKKVDVVDKLDVFFDIRRF